MNESKHGPGTIESSFQTDETQHWAKELKANAFEERVYEEKQS
jgi:hypothetical protein